MTDLHRPIALLALAGLGLGCASVTDYRPKETLVTDLGADKAKESLKATVLRAQQTGAGVVTSVDVSADGKNLKVKAQQTTLGAFYQPQTSQLENEVYFPTVEKVDVYSNNWAFVYANGGRLVLQLLFRNPEDAHQFADLLMSFVKASKK